MWTFIALDFGTMGGFMLHSGSMKAYFAKTVLFIYYRAPFFRGVICREMV